MDWFIAVLTSFIEVNFSCAIVLLVVTCSGNWTRSNSVRDCWHCSRQSGATGITCSQPHTCRLRQMITDLFFISRLFVFSLKTDWCFVSRYLRQTWLVPKLPNGHTNGPFPYLYLISDSVQDYYDDELTSGAHQVQIVRLHLSLNHDELRWFLFFFY